MPSVELPVAGAAESGCADGVLPEAGSGVGEGAGAAAGAVGVTALDAAESPEVPPPLVAVALNV